MILQITKTLKIGSSIWKRATGMIVSQVWHLSSTIVNLKSLLICKKQPRPSLFIYCPSELWTNEMQHNFGIAKKNDVGFIWAKFENTLTKQESNSRRIYTKEENDIFIINFPWTYQEHLTRKNGLNLFRKVMCSSRKDSLWSRLWILGLDNDEVVTEEMMREISLSLSELNQKTCYSFKRLWVKNDKQMWSWNSLAVGLGIPHDLQYRLYKITTAWGYKAWHQNIDFFKKRPYDTNSVIYHIAYEDSFESRMDKIKNMEAIESGSGISKMRYYCPESLEDYNQEIWIPLSQEEQDFLNAIKNS